MKSFVKRTTCNPLPTLLITISLLASALADDSNFTDEWIAWAGWAEKHYPISDKDGHGPDIGSDEWANALDRRLRITDSEGHGPDLKSEEWKSAVERKLQASEAAPNKQAEPKEQRKRLSSHDTEARFLGIEEHRCMGRTSRCPDRCGHSGKLARFEILRYISYLKPGEYGDPKQDEFAVLIEDNSGNSKIPPATLKAIKNLKPGEKVHLKWNHDYVTRKGSRFPERIITEVSSYPKPLVPDSN